MKLQIKKNVHTYEKGKEPHFYIVYAFMFVVYFQLRKIWFRCVRLKDEADLDAIRSMLYKNCISVIPIMSLSGL